MTDITAFIPYILTSSGEGDIRFEIRKFIILIILFLYVGLKILPGLKKNNENKWNLRNDRFS